MENKVKKNFPNRELAVYALYLLGGDTDRVHTEDIAIKCFELFPHSFSWVKYEQYPDKDIVRVALTDARKEVYGSLVEGRAGQKKGLSAKTRRNPIGDGWTLTINGLNWIRCNLSELETVTEAHQAKEHRQKVLKELKRIREHPLFIRYLEKPKDFSPNIGEIADFLYCRVDAEEEIWMQRFDRIRRRARSAGQEGLLDFIEKCYQAYVIQR